MGKNIDEVFDANPASFIEDTDLAYLGRLSTDMAALASTWKKYFSGEVLPFPSPPTLTFGGAAVGMAGTFTGFYVSNGPIVDVLVSIALSSKGSSTGAAVINNLPFSGNAAQKWLPMLLQNGTPTGVTYTYYSAQVANGSPSAALYNFSQIASPAFQLLNTNFTDSSIIILSGTYWKA